MSGYFREARVDTTTVVLVLGFVLVLAWMVLRAPNSSLRLSFLFLRLHVRRGSAERETDQPTCLQDEEEEGRRLPTSKR
jgi:hypothetical protein